MNAHTRVFKQTWRRRCRTFAKNEQSRHQYIYPIRERNIRKPNKGRNKVLRPENQGTEVGYARGRYKHPSRPSYSMVSTYVCFYLKGVYYVYVYMRMNAKEIRGKEGNIYK